MIVKGSTFCVGCALLHFFGSIVASQSISQEYNGRTALIYQGSTFLVSSGCEPPKCDPELKECKRITNALNNLYSYCRQSRNGNYPACLRDKVIPELAINVPIYASVCDVLCHESDPEKLRSLTVCESPAEKDEELSSYFGN